MIHWLQLQAMQGEGGAGTDVGAAVINVAGCKNEV
jgi:hypothetical protein